ncbi:hypothetical protein [Bacteroides acidifaciens]|uniref:hypothetical protein n=1 Tax=Bacteroides acidifaciens TaxID=85831 RepID=UPI0025A50D1D|nr:hypothetical protein [Bacteroides acidifaciens]
MLYYKRLQPTLFDYTSIELSDSSSEDPIDFDTFDRYQKQQPVSKRFDVDEAMSEAYSKNRDKITNASIRPIANGIYAWYNTLNILVASQGKGKSHTVIRDIIQMSRLNNGGFGGTPEDSQNPFHMIVYVSKNGIINDSTFESQRELINLPIEVVADSNAERYLKELDLWKELYNKYSSVGKSVIDDSKLQQMFEFLHISKLGKPNVPLNTIILCEDFIKSKLLKSAYFTNYITQLRHKNSIVYINIQFFKGVPTDYKNNCTSFFIFNGFSRQKLNYIYQQVSIPCEFEELWQKYRTLSGHDFILVNTVEHDMQVVYSKV